MDARALGLLIVAGGIAAVAGPVLTLADEIDTDQHAATMARAVLGTFVWRNTWNAPGSFDAPAAADEQGLAGGRHAAWPPARRKSTAMRTATPLAT